MDVKINLITALCRYPQLLLLLLLACRSGQLVTGEMNVETVTIYPDVVLNDVSHHPVGIILNYFMDDDAYLNPKRGTADALKAMGVSYLRYPGGNKSDFYFFSRPPYEKAVPTLARTGKGATGGRGKMLKNNYTEFKYDVLDFDEYIQMCRELGAEPVVVVAADEYLVEYPEGSTWSTKEQLVQHAVEWVRYANIKKKYDVKLWMIGNESWHPENENATAEIYAQDVVDFSKAMNASLNPKKKELHVYLMNLSDETKNIQPEMGGYRIKGVMESWELVGKSAEDTNPEWREVKGLCKNHMQALPATSIRVVKFALK